MKILQIVVFLGEKALRYVGMGMTNPEPFTS